MISLHLAPEELPEALYLAHVSAALVGRDDPDAMPSYFRIWAELDDAQRDLWRRTAARLTALYGAPREA